MRISLSTNDDNKIHKIAFSKGTYQLTDIVYINIVLCFKEMWRRHFFLIIFSCIRAFEILKIFRPYFWDWCSSHLVLWEHIFSELDLLEPSASKLNCNTIIETGHDKFLFAPLLQQYHWDLSRQMSCCIFWFICRGQLQYLKNPYHVCTSDNKI